MDDDTQKILVRVNESMQHIALKISHFEKQYNYASNVNNRVAKINGRSV